MKTVYDDHVELVGIFPTPIYFAMCNDDVQDSINYFESVELHNTSSGTTNNYGARSEDTYILRNDKCASLRSFIKLHLDHYARNVLAYQFNNISITQSWVSIKNPGEKHVYHKHPNSIISGCFYWNEDAVQEISFKKSFKNTNFEIERNTNVSNEFAWDFHKFSPRKNTLILFPSESEHGVETNSFNTPRKSLAFNSMIFESIGLRENLTELDLTKNSYHELVQS
jgi:uncharacterized protein (TIGR02466 family)